MPDDKTSIDVAPLIKRLDKFSNNVRIKVTRVPVRKASKIIANEMVSLSPFRSGALRDSVKSKVKTDQGGGRTFGVIGPYGKVSQVDSLGNTKKISQAYKARFLTDGIAGKTRVQENDFIERSLKNKESEASEEFDKELDKQLRKL